MNRFALYTVLAGLLLSGCATMTATPKFSGSMKSDPKNRPQWELRVDVEFKLGNLK